MVRYLPVLTTLGALCACPCAAAAADRACLPVPAEPDRRVSARWPDLPARISSALDGRPDVDGCARIALRLDSRAIVVEVVLPDGRSAARSVSRAEDVIPTLEALLLLPEAGARPPEPEPAPPPVVTPADSVPVPAPRRDRHSATVVFATAEPARAPSRLGIEFSLAAGARIGDGQTGAGIGALTFLDLRGWLVGFQGAADQYQGIEDGSTAAVLKLAVLAGRRFRLGGVALDLTAGPAVAVNGFGTRVAVTAMTGPGALPPPESDGVYKRLLCGARFTFRGGSVLRTFAGVDGEMALERSPAGLSPAEVRLPAWTAGVVVGATVGTP